MFSHLPELPPDPIYGMQVVFKKDPRPEKINLSIGICLDSSGKLLRMQSVAEAQKLILQKNPSKEYLPITGNADFCKMSQGLVCGDTDVGDLFTAQSVGGTGGLFIASRLLFISGTKTVFISDPSWPNHRPLFQAAGLIVNAYPYYNKKLKGLDFDALLNFIPTIPHKSAIVLQASCHNPTGIDPTPSQWKALSLAIKTRDILPIFDLAYLGLGAGLSEDVQGIRQFLEDGHEMFIITTYSKTFGLYNDRIGAFTVRAKKETIGPLSSQIRAIVRSCYSSPPALGAEIVSTILHDNMLKNSWQNELGETCERLKAQRKLLYDALKRHNAKLSLEQLLRTNGLFCQLDLDSAQVLKLQKEYGVYLALDGRISLAAINEQNVDTIAKSLANI